MGQKNQKQQHQQHHHILSNKMAFTIGGLLLILTGVTVGVAHIDLGRLNFFIAMAVATVKALLVALFFMGLKYDRKENGMIFATSFIFLAIFLILASTDLFFRGDVYVKGPLMAAAQGPSKLKKPWISTPELVGKGKELYAVQCVACHGVEGQGNGPAASALNPHPRNFTESEGWKNGRKPTMVFKTLKEGLPPSAMASYATLPADDRWALVHFVLSLGPKPQEDTVADFAKVGIDPNRAVNEEKEDATLPIEVAQERMAVASLQSEFEARLYHPILRNTPPSEEVTQLGQHLYQAHCVECHGLHGEGGIKVKNLGVNPVAFVVTLPFQSSTGGLSSQEQFNHRVILGLPGELMPGMGQLSSSELKELYQWVRGFSSR